MRFILFFSLIIAFGKSDRSLRLWEMKQGWVENGGWTKMPEHGNKYKFVNGAEDGDNEKETHSGAKAFCESVDAKLFEPKSAEVFTDVVKLAKLKRLTQFWIGINDKTKEGKFVYSSDGSSIDFEHWLDDRFFGETPNNWRNEDCIQIKSGKFNDANCADKYAFVCEKTA